jgi:uncharacterized membrane protein
MTTRTAVTLGLLLIAAALLYSLILYPMLPEQIPVHWGIDGRVDGWGDKQWAAFIGPIGTGVCLGLLFLLPWLSPSSFSVEVFRSTFNYLMVVLIGMLSFLHFISLQAALRPDLDLVRVLMSGLFLCFALIGNVLGKVRRNFWIGVRTPWTLASERVWIATHRLAARLMVGAGLLLSVIVWLGAPIALCFWLLMVSLLVPAIHSLLLYKRLEREGQA